MCIGVANSYRQLYRLVPVLLKPAQQFHPTCLYNFYTCQLYLLKVLGEFYALFNSFLLSPILVLGYNFFFTVYTHAVCCTHGMMVFVKQ